MTARREIDAALSLGETGLANFAPYLMNRIMGSYNAGLRKRIMALGLTTPKLRSLAVLSVMDGPLIRDLCVHTVTEQSTLSRALDALVQEGLVRRETDRHDSRATRLFITEAGRKAFQSLWPHMAMSSARMFEGIAEAERHAFVGTLQKVLLNVRQHDF
jgi:DNA-binding MarR family transcriptional regulator